jgi:hypothetical protein
MRRKTWIIALVIVVLSVALGGGLYWHWSNSPRYALQQAALALKTRNMDNFFNYLDLKEIINNFSEAAAQDANKPDDQKADDWERLRRQMGHKFTRLFLPKLVETFQPQIRKVLERYLLNLNNTQLLGVAAAVTVAEIDRQGYEARVTLTDPKTQEKLRFQMRRQPDHGPWQIVSVNYDDLKRLYKRELCR